jgi:hypothetical protein
MVMKRIEFASGQEPTVLTGTSPDCADGKCTECPGIYCFDDKPDDSIFCTHECHLARNKGN